MKIKYSKIKDFKLVTGHHFLELEQDASNSNDYSKRFEALETLTLGLYLVNNFDVVTAKKEYERLTSPTGEAEKYRLIEDVDLEELVQGIIG